MVNIGELFLNVHNWWSGTSKYKTAPGKDPTPLRIGVLAAANINYPVIIDTTQTHLGATLVGIAARDKSKAEAQIAKYGIGSTCKAYGSYDELIANPDIEAVYIPTPNGLHGVWAIKAMEEGKHVLIEKPIASNANEARQIRETAERTGKVALEAFHWRFHPAAHHVKTLVDSGKYGHVTAITSNAGICKGILGKNDIRFDYKLGGGTCMDLTYVFSTCHYFAGLDLTKMKVKVLEASPRLLPGDSRVDEAMTAKFVLETPDKPPVTCNIEADMVVPPVWGIIPQLWRMAWTATIQLERAEITYENFVSPHFNHAIRIQEKDEHGKPVGKARQEKLYVGGPLWGQRGQVWWTTYRYQLEAFVDMVKANKEGVKYQGPNMNLEESEKVMEMIDKVYEKAGMPLRGT